MARQRRVTCFAMRIPMSLLGLDTNNDSVFMNETVRDYCQQVGIGFTRCCPYRKNDQPLLVRLAEYVPPRIWNAP